MKHTDEDMTRYLKIVVITVICLLALSGTNSHYGNNPVSESKLTSGIHHASIQAVTPETTFFTILFSVDKPECNLMVHERNKVAFDSRLAEQRLKTLGKGCETIIPFPRRHINFQLIPLKQDDPPGLS
jgi:hypothetical protein